MFERLKKSVAIVTGGSMGIGYHCAKELARHGAKIMLVARNEERLKQAQQSIVDDLNINIDNIRYYPCDLSIKTSAKECVDHTLNEFGDISILVNCAGSAPMVDFSDLDADILTEAWNLKVLGYISMAKEVSRHLLKKKEGAIINIAGGAGRSPRPDFLPGSTANAAVINFSKGLSKELAASNISVNTISPGSTRTSRIDQLIQEEAKIRNCSADVVLRERESKIPTGKFVNPQEIGHLVVFLSSGLIPSLTGDEIVIDGGQRVCI